MLDRAAILPGYLALRHDLAELFGYLLLYRPQLLERAGVNGVFIAADLSGRSDDLTHQQSGIATRDFPHTFIRGAGFYDSKQFIVAIRQAADAILFAGDCALQSSLIQLRTMLLNTLSERDILAPAVKIAYVNANLFSDFAIIQATFS